MPITKSFSRKIFDIIPPEKIKEKTYLEIGIKNEGFFQSRSGKSLKVIFGVIIFLLILGGIFSHFIFQKAEIRIWPKTQEVNFEEKVTVDSKIKEVEFSTNTIPGGIFLKEQKIHQEFFSSGKSLREKKAEGTIRVYNAYSTFSQVLVTTTRFVSANGRLFRSLERVIIPGGTYKGGNLQPGFLDVNVRADQPGEEYNIDPSTFSIPGFAGTPRYTAFYGKSFEPMKGGYKGEVSEVTQQDLERAETTLKEKLLTAVKLSLENKISKRIIVLEEFSKKDFSTPIFSAKAGEEKTSFMGEGKLSFTALTFKKLDLEDFAKEYILSQISKYQKIYLESLRVSYSLETIDVNRGKMALAINFSAKIYFKILEDDFKKEIAGKLLSEAKDFLANDPRIAKLEIDFWPFWIKKIPKDVEKIIIRQEIDSEPISP